jgi:hypothetical protein
MIHGWARREGLVADLAADLVQDAFLPLLEKLPEFGYDERRSNAPGTPIASRTWPFRPAAIAMGEPTESSPGAPQAPVAAGTRTPEPLSEMRKWFWKGGMVSDEGRLIEVQEDKIVIVTPEGKRMKSPLKPLSKPIWSMLGPWRGARSPARRPTARSW